MHLVDKSRSKVLLDGGDPASKPDVLTLSSLGGSLKRSVNAIRNEVERSAAPLKVIAWRG
jgi:hypothetical protein